MGANSSTSKDQYVIGKVPPEEFVDPIHEQFESFAAARTYHIPTSFRTSTAQAYRPAEERSLNDTSLRDKIIDILLYQTGKINDINAEIMRECGAIKGFCPRHVIDNGTERELQPLDKLRPCQLRSCMKSQLMRQSAKFKRWIMNMQWAGDSAKPETANENIAIDRKGLLEILEALQTMTLRLIENASVQEVEERSEIAHENIWSRITSVSNTLVHYRLVFAVLMVIVVITIASFVLYWGKTDKMPSTIDNV